MTLRRRGNPSAPSLLALAVLAFGPAACKRHHHHHDAGVPNMVNPYGGYPTTGMYPGQTPGQVPGMVPMPYPGTMPGQMPGQVPGMMPGVMPTTIGPLAIVAPPPVPTAPDNPQMPVPPPGVIRALPPPR